MKYQLKFKSQNDGEQEFTLTFYVLGARRIHYVEQSSTSVYEHRTDINCDLTQHTNDYQHIIKAKSQVGPHEFTITIFILPEGCEIFIHEQVLTTIAHETLQPCNR